MDYIDSVEIQDFGQNGLKFGPKSFMLCFVSVEWPKRNKIDNHVTEALNIECQPVLGSQLGQ